ncbi:hypothetical protein FQA47_019733 [Oryzias melastigma]|uniref:Uncharacterized protein n=1 Tax=Oryzias melastigma TaxID=30732 RepID=A0A834FN39_ORYME|nr:hypothetical protein FQA47_019733 [Oryzias melastigma]
MQTRPGLGYWYQCQFMFGSGRGPPGNLSKQLPGPTPALRWQPCVAVIWVCMCESVRKCSRKAKRSGNRIAHAADPYGPGCCQPGSRTSS